MLRCHDRRFLNGCGYYPLAPLLLEDRLARLERPASIAKVRGDENRVVWHLLADVDPGERLQWRRKQKMRLARYARQALDYWEDREVTELDDDYATLVELFNEEKAALRPDAEDR